MKNYLALTLTIPFFLLGCPKQKSVVTIPQVIEEDLEQKIEQQENNIFQSDIYWIINDYSYALQLAEELQRPIMVDFSAEWCGPCNYIEEYIFSDQEIVALSEEFINLKVDLTNPTDETDYLLNLFQVSAIPRVVFLIDEIEQFRIYPKPKDFLKESMQEVLNTYKAKP